MANRVYQVLAQRGVGWVVEQLEDSPENLLALPGFGRRSLVSITIWAWRHGHIDAERAARLTSGQRAQLKEELTPAEFERLCFARINVQA